MPSLAGGEVADGRTWFAGRGLPDGLKSLADTPVAVWCLLMGLVFNLFSGFAGRLGLPIGPDRLLFPAAILLVALTPGSRWLRARLPHYCLLGVAAIAAWSAWTHGMMSQTEPMFALLDRIIVPFILFAAAPAFLARPTWRRRFLQVLTVIGLYLVAVTLLETLGLERLAWPRYIAETKALFLATAPEEIPRAGGPFVAGEANGMALAMCGFAAAALAALHRGVWRAVGILTGALCFVAAILSLTRSVWLGLAIGIVAIVVLTRALWKWVPALAFAGLGLTMVASAAMPELVEAIATRGGTSRSVWDRQNTNEAALRIMHDHPLSGIGWSRFVDSGWDWVRQADLVPLTNVHIEVHNVFLSRGAEIGVPALVLFVLAIVTGPVAALVRRQHGEAEVWRMFLLGCLSVWIIVCGTSPNPYPFPNFILWIVSGFCYARFVTRPPAIVDAGPASPPDPS